MTSSPNKPPNKFKALALLFLKLGSLFFVVLAIVIGWFTWQVKQREKHQGEAEAVGNEFARFTGTHAPPADAVDDASARYRKGHLLLLHAKAGMVDEMFYTLPPALRATNADDVGTVVWLNWLENVLGKYDNGGLMVKTDCDVVVYDVARKAIVAREHIVGEDPPLTITYPRGSTQGWDKRPTDSVLKFLQALPAK